jgi:hypothetical protein
MKAKMQKAIAGLLGDRYRGFGPTLAAEKLCERDGIKVSCECIRTLPIEHTLWRPKHRWARQVQALRERRARFGELIQIDGSPHDWFEGRGPGCMLIVVIDVATSRLTDLRFAPAETTPQAYREAQKAHVLAHGRPMTLYSDRHGIFPGQRQGCLER